MPDDAPVSGCSSAECAVGRGPGFGYQTPCRCSEDTLRAAARWWRRLATFRGETIRALRPSSPDLRRLWEALGLSDGEGGHLVYASVEEVLAEVRELQQIKGHYWDLHLAVPRSDWSEEVGNVLWWAFPVKEPPYVGTPLDDDFPDYVTHWTRPLLPCHPWPGEDPQEVDRGG